jgi:hypothetical protein
MKRITESIRLFPNNFVRQMTDVSENKNQLKP